MADSKHSRVYLTEAKCVVWDLDNTLWEGTLLESDSLTLKPGIRELIIKLDTKGILQSIASKNDFKTAWDKLREFNLDEYFIFPEIHWNAKSSSVSNIQRRINIAIDSIIFIDDSPFERDEVSTAHEQVETIDASQYLNLENHPRLQPRFITQDSIRRRLMYKEDIKRNEGEEKYIGPKEEFLKSLQMRFNISHATEEDLKRAEELTHRTSQLNATGQLFSFDELSRIIKSPNYLLYVCELNDRYGSYGKIGMALLEIQEDHLNLKLMLMSCRVISRSVGSVLMTFVMLKAKEMNKILRAVFKQTDRNKMMYVTYRFSNFKEISNDGIGNIIFENDLTQIQPWPHYIEVELPVIYPDNH